MMTLPAWADALEDPESQDCVVCGSPSPKATINLLNERGVEISPEVVLQGWVLPYLIYAHLDLNNFGLPSRKALCHAILTLKSLRRDHQRHLDQEREYQEGN